MGKMQIKKKVLIEQLLVVTTLIMFAFLISMMSNLNFFVTGGSFGEDAQVFGYIGWAMTKGLIPYKDIFDHKGLLLYFISYLGALIATVRGAWVFQCLFIFVAVLVTYKIARKLLNKKLALFATALSLSILYEYYYTGPSAEQYALPFHLIALYIFIDYFFEPSKYDKGGIFNLKVAICGACFGCVLFLRPNMIAIWLTFCPLIFFSKLKTKDWQQLGKFVLSFFIGLMIVTVPMILYLALNGALENFIYDYIIFNMIYSSDATFASWQNRINSFFTYFNVASSLLAFVSILIAIQDKDKKNERGFHIAYLICMLLTIVLISMAGQTWPKYGISLMPIYVYPYSLLLKYFHKTRSNNNPIFHLALLYLAITFVLPNWCNLISDAATDIAAYIESEDRGMYDNKIVKYIIANTDEDDLISVFGNRCRYYLYSNRLSASKYVYQNTLITLDEDGIIMEEYLQDLEINMPKIVIIQTANDYLVTEDFNKVYAFLNDNGYELVIDGTDEVYKLSSE